MCIRFNAEGINYYYLCPFLGFFCLVGASYAAGLSNFAKNPFIQNMIVSLGEMLAIIPYLLSVEIDKSTYKKTSGKDNSNSSKKTLGIKLEYNDQEKIIREISFYNLLVLGFIDFLQSFCFFYSGYFSDYPLYFWSSNIFFLCFFTKHLLSSKIYRHHLFSLAIFFCLDVINIIFVLLDEKIKCQKIIFIFLLISSVCFSFELVFEKKLMDVHFFSIYKLCFIIGITTFFFNLIVTIIMTILSNHLEKKSEYIFNFLDYFNKMSENIYMEITMILIYMLLTGFHNIFQFLTIKHLSPSHTLITQIMLSFFCSIMNMLFTEMKTITCFISLVFHSICIIVLLIFLEVIELKFCGIDKDTKHNINKRAELERYMQNANVNESVNDNSVNSSEMMDLSTSF
jgi:hypothetical protein